MRIKNKLTSIFLPPKVSKGQGINFFRRLLLHYLVLSLATVGFLTYLPSIYFSVQLRLYGIIFIDTLTIGFVFFLLLKKLSFQRKTLGLLVIFYFLGLGLLIALGPAGAGPLWLLMFSIMTSVLLGIGPAVISLGINAATWIFLSLFVYLGKFPWMDSLPNAGTLWIVIGVNLICINAIVALSVAVLINQISKMFQKEKTAALKLKQEIETRIQTEEKNEELASKLLNSQKMEAIGTLAGGVAHDLNNVLSAQVGYPDLILMDLPEDSPVRESVLKIQESGHKAAAIVEDLLTMARRGVVVTDVMDLNQILDNYLNSPECEKLKTFHPNMIIKSRLDADLSYIMGSSVHLFKTVMNLVNNAAEAMPYGGDIIISTQNQYIDKPVKGYDSVKKGDYVTLMVSDTGTGIEPKDIERIFEPFYTKKKMGRSGTGLGMAVVWGTVQDHKGYIGVQSIPGLGTTFTLYFPATRKEIGEQKTTHTVEEYMGKKESILIVDDVKEQRKIASDMLEKLGYTVTLAANGEQAVEYMKKNPVNLLILDMIMDPGIDGCETYKQILELYPEQKAIITSGFSENDRVKEAQKLGAGEYIKKPYTFEKIGFAVKTALNK